MKEKNALKIAEAHSFSIFWDKVRKSITFYA
jgi:hypothetical protein